jgi:guanylate kinase
MQTAAKVRKQFLLEPGKIEMVRRITHATTDTEAINKALDMVIANEKIHKALAAVKGKGKIEDVFGRLSI